jgi:signal transduction histidine kinase
MAVVLAAVGLLLYLRVGSHLDHALNNQLRLRAHDLAALAREPGTPLLSAPKSPFVEQGESYAQLTDARGRVLDASLPLGRQPLLTQAEVANGLKDSFFVDRASVPGLDEPSRMLVAPVVRNHRRAVLLVGTTMADRTETLASLRNELLISGTIALFLATLAGYLLAGFALRPVERMRARAEEISAETPGERLPVPHTRDEVERLGNTLNEMLERLEAALERERDFVADAGHELRTPLSLLRSELELALRHAETTEELREAVARSSDEVDRLAQLAEPPIARTAREDRGPSARRRRAAEHDREPVEWRAEG